VTLVAAFDWAFVRDNQDVFFQGLQETLTVSAIAIAGALAIGLFLGAARTYRTPFASQLAAVYVELIRNTPLLAQVFFLYFGLPQLGYDIEPFTAAWLSLMLWGGAFNTENFRAGFGAVPLRYREGAFALGFDSIGTFLNVTLPIGGRIALPSSINTCVSILKNSAVLGPAIGFAELTYEAYSLESSSFKALEIYTVLAVLYLAIVWAISAAIRALESHLRLPEERRGLRRQPLGEAA
jgi:His/Glu/Gln/Arg/opine family amino acid ABC transporter permease subunit